MNIATLSNYIIPILILIIVLYGLNILVITNTGDNDAIVSLTKIKFTFESKPAISPQLVVNQNDAKYINHRRML